MYGHTRQTDYRRDKNATLDDEYLVILSGYVLCSWPSTKAELMKELQSYWSLRDEVVIIDRSVMKGRGIIIPASLQDKLLKDCT